LAANINGTSPLRYAGAPASGRPLAIVARAYRVGTSSQTAASLGTSGSTSGRWSLRAASSERLQAYEVGADGTSGSATSANGSLPASAWTLIGGLYLAAGDRRAYSGASTATNTSSLVAGTPDDFRIGCLNDGSEVYSGELAEVAVWDLSGWGADTAERVAAFAAAFAAMRDESKAPDWYPTGLVGYWPLIDDGQDRSGNGYHLTGSPSSWSAHPPGIVYAGEEVAPAVLSRWAGGVTSSGVVVVARVTVDSDVRVNAYAASDTTTIVASSPVASAVAATNDRTTRHEISGLSPDTAYTAYVEIDGSEDRDNGQSFATAPTEGEAAFFAFGFGSCAQTGSNSSVFGRILARGLSFFQHLGDLHYSDIEADDLPAFRAAYGAVLSSSAQSALYAALPIDYVWDDHDYEANNGDAASLSRPAAQSAYRECFPHYPLPHGEGIYHSFVRGRVRFVVTDNRSFKVPGDGTMLGAEQKAWFFGELESARDAGQVVLWVNSVPWIAGPGDGDGDHWGGHATERAEIADWWLANDLVGRVAMLCGDAHMIAADDGTNSDYATGGGAPVVVLHASSLHQTHTTKGGPYSEGTTTSGTGHYGVVTVADDGGASVGLSFRGYDSSDVAAISLDFDLTPYVAPNAVPDTPTIAAGTPGVSSVALTSSAFSDADEGDAHASSRWQVAAADDADFASPAIDTGDDAAHLIAYTATGLEAGTAYLARVRHADAAGGASDWSEAAGFTTASAPAPPIDHRASSADRPLEVAAGLSESWTVTLRDPLGDPVAGLTGEEALGVLIWPGDDRAALAWTASASGLDADAATLALEVAAPADAAPGPYRLRLTVAGRLAFESPLGVLASPGSGAAPPTYATYDELLRVAPWVAGLEGPYGRAGFEEERHEARAALEELAQAHDRSAGDGGGDPPIGTFAGGWASRPGGHARSETLAGWLADDRLVVTPDVRAYCCHHAAGTIARRQVGPGKATDYLALAAFHEGEADRRARLLLLGIDTSEPADGAADYWISCSETRIALA
jgi:phosphodiesterase/alkaline phosphatase D-like protein